MDEDHLKITLINGGFMSKTKLTGIVAILTGIAAIIACFASGDYTHIGEAVAGIIGGFGLVFGRVAIDKLEKKIDAK
jgi:uncharacterized membrane protein HdeD (DUF308 family)